MCCVVLFTLLCACGGAAEPLSPTGTYNLSITYGAGDCGQTGTATGVFTVVDSGSMYSLSTEDPTEVVQGTITCAEECEVSAESTFVDDPTKLAYNFTILPSGKVTGSGSVTGVLEDGTTCSQVFTISGQKI
jgi:hypothetical protein